MAILRPRASRIAPREAAAMPLPNEDTTPPVTNTKRVITIFEGFPSQRRAAEKADERRADKLPQVALRCEPSRPALSRALMYQADTLGCVRGALDGLIHPQRTHCKQR